MEPKDKFGNPLYPRLFQKLQEMGKRLERCGYQEAKQKPNLFVKRWPNVVFFVDFRGTEEIPIWEDYAGLFYWKFAGPRMPLRVRQQMIKLESGRTADVPKRLATLILGEPEAEAADFVHPPDVDRRFTRSPGQRGPQRMRKEIARVPIVAPVAASARERRTPIATAMDAIQLGQWRLLAAKNALQGLGQLANGRGGIVPTDTQVRVALAAQEKAAFAAAEARAALEIARTVVVARDGGASDLDPTRMEADRVISLSQAIATEAEGIQAALEMVLVSRETHPQIGPSPPSGG